MNIKYVLYLIRHNSILGLRAAEHSQFWHALRYQNKSKGLVWHYINIDPMLQPNSIETLIETGLLLTKESLATRRDFLKGV